MNTLTPAEIILASMRLDTSQAQKAHLLSDLSPDAWHQAVNFANNHEVLALLSACWRDLALPAGIPDQVLRASQVMILRNRVRTNRMLKGLSLILSALHAAAIPVIVLKGAHLVEDYYADLGLRPMSDLDLLVRAEDIEPVTQAMTLLGFESDPSNQAQQEIGKHLLFKHAESEVSVEVHWQLLAEEHNLKFSPNFLWETAIPITVAGMPALGLPAESMLPYFAMHLYNHRFQVPLRQVWDTVVVVQKSPPDWQKTLAFASTWQMERSLAVLLYLVSEFWGVQYPQAVQSFIDKFDVQVWGQAAAQNILNYKPDNFSFVSPRFLNLWFDGSAGSNKLKNLWHGLFPSPQWMSIRYQVPGSGFPLFAAYLRRFAALPFDYGKASWSLLQGEKETRRRFGKQKALLDWLEGK